jgi:hypothetical protein
VDLIIELREKLSAAGLDAGPDTLVWHLQQQRPRGPPGHHRSKIQREWTQDMTQDPSLTRRAGSVARPVSVQFPGGLRHWPGETGLPGRLSYAPPRTLPAVVEHVDGSMLDHRAPGITDPTGRTLHGEDGGQGNLHRGHNNSDEPGRDANVATSMDGLTR